MPPEYPMFQLQIQNSDTGEWKRVELLWYLQPAIDRAKNVYYQTENNARVVHHITKEVLFSTERK